MNDPNEKRCIAHQIILELHSAGQTGQIRLLLQACELSLGIQRPQIHNKRLVDKIGRLILDECGNYPLMESVVAALSPQSKFENRDSKIQ